MWGDELLSGVESMCVDGSACVGVKGGVGERFGMDGEVRQGCVVSPWLFNVYMDGVVRDLGMGMGGRGVGFLEDGREGILLCPMW